MKLKYYLRGLGVGIICTAILMGIALSGTKKEKLTDTEIIERARLLGMVMAEEASDAGGTAPQNPDGQEENSPNAQGGEGSKSQGQGSDGQEGEASAGQDSKNQDGDSGSSAQDGKDSGSSAQDGEDSGSSAQDGEDSDAKGKNDSESQGESGQEKDKPTNKAQGTEEGASDSKPSSNSKKKEGMVEFEITERDHSEDVSEKLFKAGLISNANDFNQYMIDQKVDGHLQAGKYQIPAGATDDEILDMIIKLPQ